MFEDRHTTVRKTVRKTLVNMSKSKPAASKPLAPSTPTTANETGAMSESTSASPKPIAPPIPTTTKESNIAKSKPTGKYTIGAMSQAKSASPKTLASRGLNTANKKDFPALAPSAKKLDMTPRKPIAAMPPAVYRKPDPPTQHAKPKDNFADEALATGLPRCADPKCPIRAAHLAKRYTTESSDLPHGVLNLVDRALSASKRAEHSSKQLDLFFAVHCRDHCEADVVTFVADSYDDYDGYDELQDEPSYDSGFATFVADTFGESYDESFEGTYQFSGSDFFLGGSQDFQDF